MKSLSNRILFLRVSSVLLVSMIFYCCIGNKGSRISQPVLKVGQFELAVPGGNIWYQVTGDSKGIPVVLIHGGPGMSSYYLKPFEDLGNDRQVIRYDQLGGGKSDVIKDTALFTIDHFVKELESLRNHLGVKRWHIFGHSWGTVIAFEYYRAYPDRVVSLILGSLCLDVKAWQQNTRHLLTSLPVALQDAVKKAELTGNYNDTAYQKAMDKFYSLYVWRNPVKADLDSMFAAFNTGIYSYMWGPSEFSIIGTLKNYNGASFLPQIKVPTLFTVGEFDEISSQTVKDLAATVPSAQYVMFKGSSHMTPWDAREESIQVVREFLHTADSMSSVADK